MTDRASLRCSHIPVHSENDCSNYFYKKFQESSQGSAANLKDYGKPRTSSVEKMWKSKEDV